MNNEPLVSIIVPCYKVEQYLPVCIESILNQTYANWELILVDDGSPDRCPQICDEYASQDDRIKVIHKENGGQSSARNAALEIMKGDLCMFVDSDDFIHERTVEICYNLMVKHGADIVEHCSIKTPERTLPDLLDKHEQIRIYDNHTIFTRAAETVLVWGKLYKRDLWDGVRFPLMKENEDDATAWKLYYRAKRIVKTNLILYLYFVNESGITCLQSKFPHIECPLRAYSERMAFFRERNEDSLVTISQWRLLKYIVLSYKSSRLTIDQKDILFSHYKKNYIQVLKSKFVPITQKILFVLFRINTKFCRFAYKRKV